MMKFVLLLFFLFIFVAMLLNSGRKRGMLSKDADRAVAGLASAMRWFLFGLLALGAAVCGVLIYQGA
ncbi:hypothetical protein [Massilia brevitalea]|uniref:hypothetical protein n=1 Tax=Massilia brevitalea TaxID=442526 RepID=UPI002738F33F|nr:hypothetical protein [Massilia brevitalea]